MLAHHRTLLEEEFLASMDMLLNSRYMSNKELDNEHPFITLL